MHQDNLSTTEAAAKLQVSVRTLHNMIKRGSINAHKLDPSVKSVYRIPQSEIDRILAERAQPKDILGKK